MSCWYNESVMRTFLLEVSGDMSKEIFGRFIPPRIYIGKLGLNLFAATVSMRSEKRKVFIVTDKVVERHAKKIAKTLEGVGLEIQIWNEATPEPPMKLVKRCGEEIEKFGPDLIVAVGGGSAIDLAKAAWILYEIPGTDLKMVNPYVPMGLRKKAILAAFPTTSGTGSETTRASVVTDDSVSPPRKIEIVSEEIVPDYAVLIPEFTAGMPPELTAGTGLDALAHAVDAYLNAMASDFTDPLALKAMDLVLEFLPRAYKNPDDMEARFRMQIAATMAGLAFGNSNVALTHSLGHSVGSVFGIHHGVAVGIFIPYSIQYYSKISDKYVGLARWIGIEAKNEEEYLVKLVEKFKKFMKDLNVSYVLKDYVAKEKWEENLDDIVKYAFEDAVTPSSPRPPGPEDIKKILEHAYEGKDVDF